ncbi:MAG: TerC family protein [Planctomycetes bacterium]|nr:TerC family protein [Planctomycetota bacterium]
MPVESIGTPGLWAAFLGLVLALLALDLGVFHRSAHAVTIKEAAIWSVVWVAVSLAFNGFVYYQFGPDRALEFTTGYLLEKALAVDNIFVFVAVFGYFAVPSTLQHRVLFWGILGALLMRGGFIGIGSVLIAKFHWILYVFGGLLVITALKMMFGSEEEVHPERNPVLRVFRRFVPVTSEFHGARFTIVKEGKRFATPLLVVLTVIEVSDLIFAVDSIPAIFAVTTDPFIVFTSNIFAILGLRSMYFLLAGVIDKFHYLKQGLAFVLLFVGTKMLIMDVYKIPIAVSLGVVAALIAGSIALSLLKPKKQAE